MKRRAHSRRGHTHRRSIQFGSNVSRCHLLQMPALCSRFIISTYLALAVLLDAPCLLILFSPKHVTFSPTAVFSALRPLVSNAIASPIPLRRSSSSAVSRRSSATRPFVLFRSVWREHTHVLLTQSASFYHFLLRSPSLPPESRPDAVRSPKWQLHYPEWRCLFRHFGSALAAMSRMANCSRSRVPTALGPLLLDFGVTIAAITMRPLSDVWHLGFVRRFVLVRRNENGKEMI